MSLDYFFVGYYLSCALVVVVVVLVLVYIYIVVVVVVIVVVVITLYLSQWCRGAPAIGFTGPPGAHAASASRSASASKVCSPTSIP